MRAPVSLGLVTVIPCPSEPSQAQPWARGKWWGEKYQLNSSDTSKHPKPSPAEVWVQSQVLAQLSPCCTLPWPSHWKGVGSAEGNSGVKHNSLG